MKNIDRDSKSDIINSLLRTNFDIKDESLDIDLSVCAAIPNSGTSGIPLWVSVMEETADYFKASTSDSTPVILGSSSSIRSINDQISEQEPPVQIADTKKTIPERPSSNSVEPICIKKEKCDFTEIKLEPPGSLDINKNNENTISLNLGGVTNGISSNINISSKNENTIALNITVPNGIASNSKTTSNNSPKSNVERRNLMIECPDCGKSLKLGSMWMHRKIHNTNSKRYCCDICGQKFVQKVNLTNHLKLHNAERSFECPECQKTFPERSHMIRHQKYHSDLRPYKCEKCGKMYKTERCLKVHSLVHLDQRPFVCTVCNKSFLSNSKLKQHSNIHTGERPYKCKYCSRDFTNFPNWLKHTRRRHNVDHKTGEVLQKIPSYCSKQKKNKQNSENNQNDNLAKQEILTLNQNDNQAKQEIIPLHEIKKEPLDINVINISEKKKKMVKEDTKDDIIKTNFNDLHSLSLTSAEDLIMEQALEMEEAGYINSHDQPICTGFEKNPNFLNQEHIFGSLCSSDNSPLSSPSSATDCKMPVNLLLPLLNQSTVLPQSITANISSNFFVSSIHNTQQNNNNIINNKKHNTDNNINIQNNINALNHHQILPSVMEAFLGFQKIQPSNI